MGVWLSNLVMVAGSLWAAWELTFRASGAIDGLQSVCGPLSCLALAWAGVVTWVSLNFRRRRRWAWSVQLMLLCLIVGLGSLPGLLWVPLLVAWCSPPVRDWFDPPARRHFG
ncbi:MAG: hypothetical protein IT204_08860 [Fimbriimonadaceae bacterium]|nr:hypothetical protein [Fimbriimonadaceae bacterium]